MKNVIRLCAVVALLMFAGNAFSQNKIGLMLGYGTEVEELGFGVNGEFGISSKVSISPNFIYWFVEGNDVSAWEINANVNYYFQQNFYGLAGLNFFHVNVGDFDNTELGLNLGVGYNFDTGKNLIPFGEAKFVLGDADQLGLFFGLRFKM